MMTRADYQVAKPLFYVVCLVVGIVFSFYTKRRKKELAIYPQALVAYTSAVALCSVFYWAWVSFVDVHVPIRDEGMALAIEYVFYIGPAALLGLVLSLACAPVRKMGALFSLTYIIGALGIFVLVG